MGQVSDILISLYSLLCKSTSAITQVPFFVQFACYNIRFIHICGACSLPAISFLFCMVVFSLNHFFFINMIQNPLKAFSFFA